MDSTVENQRKTDRVAPAQPTITLYGIGPKPIPALVIDESFGGLGVAIPVKVQAGREIDVQMSAAMGGVHAVAIVRHVKDLPSGCRLGLEWKALALSRRLRELLSVDQSSQKHKELRQILPGGLSVMWKLYEGQRWSHIVDCADRLRKEAAACKVHELSAPIEQFQNSLRTIIYEKSGDKKNAIRIELDKLILRCIEIIS